MPGRGSAIDMSHQFHVFLKPWSAIVVVFQTHSFTQNWSELSLIPQLLTTVLTAVSTTNEKPSNAQTQQNHRCFRFCWVEKNCCCCSGCWACSRFCYRLGSDKTPTNSWRCCSAGSTSQEFWYDYLRPEEDDHEEEPWDTLTTLVCGVFRWDMLGLSAARFVAHQSRMLTLLVMNACGFAHSYIIKHTAYLFGWWIFIFA